MSSNRNSHYSPKSRSEQRGRVNFRDGEEEDVTLTEPENLGILLPRRVTPTKNAHQSPSRIRNYLSPANRTPPLAAADIQSDVFYTPLLTNNGASSSEASFVTPLTSQKPRTGERFEHRRITQDLIGERMNRNFEELKDAFRKNQEEEEVKGRSPLPLRHTTKLPGAVEDMTHFEPDSVEISPKVRPVFEERLMMTKLQIKENSSDMNYVKTLCAAVEVQRKYKGEGEKMLKQLDKMEVLKKEVDNMARRMSSSSPLAPEFDDVELKKRLAKIEIVKQKLSQVIDVKRMTHEIQFTIPFVVGKKDELRYRIIDKLIDLDQHDFGKIVSRETRHLSKELNEAIGVFRKTKEVVSERRRERRRRSEHRESLPLKILPLDETQNSSSEARENVSRRDAETQVTGRVSQPSVKPVLEIEPLDFSQLEPSPVLGKNEKAAAETPIDNVLDSIRLHGQTVDLNQTQDLNVSIGDSSFFNNSSDVAKRFETHYPSRPNSSNSAEMTPRSARSSMDANSARRFSDGVAHFLEKHQHQQQQKLKEHEEKAPEEAISEAQAPEEVPEETVDEKNLGLEQEEIVQIEENDISIDDVGAEVPLGVVEQMPEYLEDEEGDEVKKFAYSEEYEDDFEMDEVDEAEQSQESTIFENGSPDEQMMNESADDSGFLLNHKPPPRLTSILDLQTSSTNSELSQKDTPRIPNRPLSQIAEEPSTQELDVDYVCRKDLLPAMTENMITKAVELQSELKGCDWVTALDVWDPMSILDSISDDTGSFESFWILVWGKIVDILNRKYLKFDVRMTEEMVRDFRAEVVEIVEKTFGLEAKNVEWHEEIQLSKRLKDLMIFGVDYRHEQRRQKPIEEQQMYRFTQLQMQQVALHYTPEILNAQIQEIVEKNKEDVASVAMNSEIEKVLAENQ